jgi:hypothetical protein
LDTGWPQTFEGYIAISFLVEQVMDRTSKLNAISVASPCSVPWDKMTGDDRTRFCQQCHLNVYNLSEMSAAQANRLIERTEGRTCVRFYRRADGSVMTRDCPAGVERMKAIGKRMCAFLSFVVAYAMWGIGGLRPAARETPAPRIPAVEREMNNNVTQGTVVFRAPIPPGYGNIAPYRKELLRRLASNWHPKAKKCELELLLDIAPDGRLLNVFPVPTAATAETAAALQAARKTKYAPLPNWYKGKHLMFQIRFEKLRASEPPRS